MTDVSPEVMAKVNQVADIIESSIVIPAIPQELWMLRVTHDDDGEVTKHPRWCVAYDNPVGAKNYLVCFTEDEAEVAAIHQEVYGIGCIPVRVK